MSPHVNPTTPDRTFHAAYNFIPLADQVFSVADDPSFLREAGGEKARIWEIHDRFIPGTLSGWIDLEITAETPLYIRCGVAPEHARDPEARTNPHRQEFYHHGEPERGEPRPCIPGSSLRGMVRGLLEIVSFGKMQWFSGAATPKRLAYRGVGDSSSMGRYYRDQLRKQHLRGGYLHVDGDRWSIRPAVTFGNASFVRVDYDNAAGVVTDADQQTWKRVYVKAPGGASKLDFPITDVVRSAQEPGLVPAALVISGHITGSHPKHMHCAIYEADPNAQPIAIPDDMRRTYLDDLGSIRGTLPRPLGTEGDPLFYLWIDNELIFFGPTLMFRMPYERTIGDFVPEHLRKNGDVDLAEAIFGRVGESTIKGRVRFEDAPATAAAFLDGGGGRRSPKILGTPKPTSFQLYLEQDRPDDPHSLRHWGSNPGTTKIRGWKRYWHRPSAGDSDRFEAQLKSNSTDSQYTVIRPVKGGSRFAGRIRFDNLLPLELGALLFVLDLSDSMRHHLGMGKARGLGSVKVRPSLTLIDRRGRYARLFGGDGQVEESLVDREQAASVAKTAREQFTKRMAAFAHSRETDLWRLPRLALLGAMLKWDGAPPLERITSPELGATLWRSRAVLQTPDAVAGVPIPQEIRPPDLTAGLTIEAVLRSDKTSKGGPRFDIPGSDRIAILHPKSAPLPLDAAAGAKLKLVVRSGGDTPQLAWIDPAAPPPAPPKGGPPKPQKSKSQR